MPTCSAAPAGCSTPCRRLAAGRETALRPLAWNHQQHLELYYGAICGGYVLHTINPRLFDDQLAGIINHAQDKWLFTDRDFIPTLERLEPRLKHVNGIVVLGTNADAVHSFAHVYGYEELLAGQDDACAWPELDENSACAMCYTSGTTGNPKGVLYSPQVAPAAHVIDLGAGCRRS